MLITLAIACRSWRQTVFRSPELWSYFRLPLYKQIPRHSKGYTGMVVQQLRGTCLKSRYGIDGTRNRIVVAALTKVNIRHLKFIYVDDTWPRPSSAPSPAHLWLGYSNPSYLPRKVLSPIGSRLPYHTHHLLERPTRAPDPCLVCRKPLPGGRPLTLALAPLLGDLRLKISS